MAIALALDLDGTLLNTESALPVPAVSDLLADARMCAARVIVLTARPIQDVARLFRSFDEPLEVWASDGAVRATVRAGRVVGINGEAVLSGRAVGHTVTQLIDHEARPEILLFGTSACDFEIAGYSSHASLSAADHLACVGDVRPLRRVDSGVLDQLARVRDLRAVACLGPAAQIASVAAAHEPIAGAQYLHYAESRIPGLSWFDVLAHGVSKGQALRVVREESSSSLTIVAAGNGANDISMFEEATISVCPADCDRELAALATRATSAACGEELVLEIKHALQEALG